MGSCYYLRIHLRAGAVDKGLPHGTVLTARTMLKQRSRRARCHSDSSLLSLSDLLQPWLLAETNRRPEGWGSLGDKSSEVSLPHGREEQKTVSTVKIFIQALFFFFFNLLDCSPVLSCSLQNLAP